MCETIIACAIAASRLRALQYDEETKGRRRAYGYSHRSEVGRTAVPADTQPDHRGHRHGRAGARHGVAIRSRAG